MRAVPPEMRIIKCHECGKRLRRITSECAWNAIFSDGAIVGYLCPGCQTPTQNAEAVVNQATLQYGRDRSGRYFAQPKAGLP